MNRLFYFLFLTICLNATAQITTFSLTLKDKSQYSNIGKSLLPLENGDFVIDAHTHCNHIGFACVQLFRVDSLGNEIWQKRYDGGYHTFQPAYIQPFAKATNGDVMVLVLTYRTGEGRNIGLMRLNEEGDSLWLKQYGGTKLDIPRSIAATSDGGFIIGGFTKSYEDSIRGDALILKLDKFGNEEWMRTWGVHGMEDDAYWVLEDYDKGFIVGGLTEIDIQTTGRNGILMKLDSSGNMIWEKRYGNSEQLHGPPRPIPSKFGGYFYTGTKDTVLFEGAHNSTSYLARLDSSGNTVWEIYFEAEGNKQLSVFQARELEDGSFIVCGNDENTGFNELDWHPYGVLGKLSADGELLWMRKYAYLEEIAPSILWDVVATSDGGLMASGWAMDTIGGNNDANVWLLKVDDRGCLEPDCEDDVIITDIEEVWSGKHSRWQSDVVVSQSCY